MGTEMWENGGHAIDGREEGEEERKQGQGIGYCVCVLLASCTYN